jgi:hypothetical protein
LHFYKRRLCCFPHSSLPVNKLGLSQFPILAKRRYTLPALLLLGYQNPPLRQGLLSALIHAPSLPQSALADKMWFRYRSPYFAIIAKQTGLQRRTARRRTPPLVRIFSERQIGSPVSTIRKANAMRS